MTHSTLVTRTCNVGKKKGPHGLGIGGTELATTIPHQAGGGSIAKQPSVDSRSVSGCNNAGAQLKASAPAARLTPAGPARSHETARCEAVPSALSSAVANRHTGRPAHGWSRVLIVNSDRQDIHPTRRTSPAAARAVQLNRRPPRPLLLRYPLTGPARGPQRADAADAIHIAFAKAVPNGRPPGDGRGRRSTRWDRASLGRQKGLSPGPEMRGVRSGGPDRAAARSLLVRRDLSPPGPLRAEPKNSS